MSAASSCVETMTGSELLRTTEKILPAEVKVKCFYSVKDGALNVTSSDSELTIISINNLVPPTLTVNPLVIIETDSVTLDCQPPSSVSVTDCYFFIGGGSQARRFNCQKRLKAEMILSLTQRRSPANFHVTCFYLDGHQSPNSNMLTIIIQIPPPELIVNPQLITETDLVTLNCGTPSSVSVDKCFLYFITSKIPRIISCEQTMSGRELLMMTFQTSPAEVELTCYYTVKKTDGGQHQSPNSNLLTIIIQIPPPELTVTPQLITETDSVTLNCRTPSFVSVDKCFLNFITSKITKVISCEQTMSGRELLIMTFQTSPAEVELTCYYTVKNTDGGQHQSPDSNIQSVMINKVKELDSTTSQGVSTFSMTAS
ncbi:uncharacterized protein LOC119780016 [Cyprinodon tularosa]|uniref:uncharacterized protein LOC119780016 n=1 Tax=Cyprinodon tularosa TaxID=77115 RepID=UPI0018E1E928|nr:uncharacterized protein LOC119780016 [Cyprinodon tularosa]